MANRTKQSHEKTRQPSYAGVGLILGAAAGFSLGLGNPVMGAMGAAIGLILGAGLDARRKLNSGAREEGGEI